ncbi:4-oxalomesaconate tautomerase [soil metagenome]
METDGIRCMMMRGGTSKGAYFLAEDLPTDATERDALLLAVMGSPDPRQIDGIGGADPLTSKVAVISPSADPSTDVDYLFLQVMVDRAVVTDRQNCGNLLAGVGPFAIERGLVAATDELTSVRIRMVNSDSVAVATFPTPGGMPDYRGDTAIDGVPGTAAAVRIEFTDTAGSSTGALLPTGNVTDSVEGVTVTCVDNGMPSVLIAASALGLSGDESPESLQDDVALNERLAAIRLAAARLMGMGDVSSTTVPKLVLLSAPRDGGVIATRSFLPVKVHSSIGVLGALTVAAGVSIPGAVGNDLALLPEPGEQFRIEHPTGHFDVVIDVVIEPNTTVVRSSGTIRTARKLFDGTVFPRPI